MSLNSLPPELTALVISYLAELETTDPSASTRSKTNISCYASTSVNIRHAVESLTFSSLRITSDDLPMFEGLVIRSSSRQTLLRSLTFQPVLPAYSKKACTRFERQADRRRNDEAYSLSIEKLFATLKPLDEVENAASLSLFLTAPYSPSDGAHRDERVWGPRYNGRTLGINGDLHNARFLHSYLHLSRPPGFPILDKISQFGVANNGLRFMAPGPIFSLLENMPHVNDLFLRLYDNEKKKPGLRKQLRIDFGKALNSSSRHSSLEKLDLEYLFEDPLDHRFTGSDMRIACGKAVHDPFSLDLHRFISSCSTLVRVNLTGPICVDETLFWSPESCSEDIRWPSLKCFRVDMSCFRPDGGWYLDEHPDFPRDEPYRVITRESDSDSEHDSIDSESTSIDGADEPVRSDHGHEDNEPADDYSCRRQHWEALRAGDAYILFFRSEPTEALERVWVAAARAAAAMPRLCSMSVGMSVSQCSRTDVQTQELGFEYGADGFADGGTGSPANVPQLHWTAPNGWRMSEELQALWEKVLGAEGEVTYEYW